MQALSDPDLTSRILSKATTLSLTYILNTFPFLLLSLFVPGLFALAGFLVSANGAGRMLFDNVQWAGRVGLLAVNDKRFGKTSC